MPNLVVLGQTMYALVAENPQNWGPLGPRCLGVGSGWPLKTNPSPFASKCVYINRREPQNWGALGHRPFALGAWLTPRNTLLPRGILPNSIVLGQMVRALLRRSTWKLDRVSQITKFDLVTHTGRGLVLRESHAPFAQMRRAVCLWQLGFLYDFGQKWM